MRSWLAAATAVVLCGQAAAQGALLNGDSTLAQWTAASPSERSGVAVGLARNRLPATATKLDVAKTAMEISGCLSKTAEDQRLSAWKVAPTAATCLDAPERGVPQDAPERDSAN